MCISITKAEVCISIFGVDRGCLFESVSGFLILACERVLGTRIVVDRVAAARTAPALTIVDRDLLEAARRCLAGFWNRNGIAALIINTRLRLPIDQRSTNGNQKSSYKLGVHGALILRLYIKPCT